ncbi:hypothetical protein Ga0061061_10790 [Chelatococcus sambhunathii]|uniref:Uncharacterized protein n=3 Tax=Chelatococcaceae TaxID=2036754 RepID=A0AAC9NYP4_9HYPH|nr:hypothetical protein BOQ54_07665 [Chelatococcus daeguensis]CUA89280.1 hypothetical protein Ga0061061_10790 [Chelatococcus sambhunathii]
MTCEQLVIRAMLRRRSDTQHSFGALVLAVLALAVGIVLVLESAWDRRLPPAPAAAPVRQNPHAPMGEDPGRHVAQGQALVRLS